MKRLIKILRNRFVALAVVLVVIAGGFALMESSMWLLYAIERRMGIGWAAAFVGWFLAVLTTAAVAVLDWYAGRES